MAKRTITDLELQTDVYELVSASAAYWIVRSHVCDNLRSAKRPDLHPTSAGELPDADERIVMRNEDFEALKYIADQLAGHAKQVTDWVFNPEKGEPANG